MRVLRLLTVAAVLGVVVGVSVPIQGATASGDLMATLCARPHWYHEPGHSARCAAHGYPGPRGTTTTTTSTTTTKTTSTSTTTTVPRTTTTTTTDPPTTTTTTTTQPACTNQLTGGDVVSLDGGAHHLQADEWDSDAPFTVCNDGGDGFAVQSSSIDNATDGAPGAYPSLYEGCHWGDCTSGSGLPVQVSAMTPGIVTTSYDTTTSSGQWDDSYDIWFNSARSTDDNQSGLEMMIWLGHTGVQPKGSVVAPDVSIDGSTWNVWYGSGTVSYVATTSTTSVNDLDLGPFADDSVSRGYMTSLCYLIDVEAGFEVWQGGAGLTANSFSLTVNG